MYQQQNLYSYWIFTVALRKKTLFCILKIMHQCTHSRRLQHQPLSLNPLITVFDFSILSSHIHAITNMLINPCLMSLKENHNIPFLPIVLFSYAIWFDNLSIQSTKLLMLAYEIRNIVHRWNWRLLDVMGHLC